MHMGCAIGVQTRHSRVRRARCLLGYGGLMEKLRCMQACMACMACDRQFRTWFRYVHQSNGVQHYEVLKVNSVSARQTRKIQEYILRGVRGRRQVIPLCRIWYATRPVLARRWLAEIAYNFNGPTIQFDEKHQVRNHRYHGRTRERTRNP